MNGDIMGGSENVNGTGGEEDHGPIIQVRPFNMRT
jgi:hypothetical protein